MRKTRLLEKLAIGERSKGELASELPLLCRGAYWISGIDTNVGKTVVTGLLARFLLARGVDALTVKMVQTGNEGRSEDIEAHRELCGLGPLREDAEGLTAPQIFKFPSSPELAARMEGRVVDVERIVAAVKKCAERHRVVLVESAGGLAVPLTEDLLSVDLAAREGWPLVLVTCGRLGAINHTFLSLEAAKARGMRVAGVVHNYHPGVDATIDADTVAAVRRQLARLGFPPVVVTVPKVEPGRLPDVDFSELFS